MKFKFAVAGLVALGGMALGAGAASAMPNGLAQGAGAAAVGEVTQVRLVCDAYGRCWHRPSYYAPRYYAPPPRYGYYGGPRWNRGYGRGYGYGRGW